MDLACSLQQLLIGTLPGSRASLLLANGCTVAGPHAASRCCSMQAGSRLTISCSRHALRDACGLLPLLIAAKTFDDTTKQLWAESLCIFAIVWSIGATGDTDARKAFNQFFRWGHLPEIAVQPHDVLMQLQGRLWQSCAHLSKSHCALCGQRHQQPSERWACKLSDTADCRSVMGGAVPAGYEEYLLGSRPKMAAPMMPDADGATVYDFTFDKVSARQTAGISQHRHLGPVALIAERCNLSAQAPWLVAALASSAAACCLLLC